jgi:hypothetical protein
MVGLVQDGMQSGRYGTLDELSAFYQNQRDDLHSYRPIGPYPFSGVIFLDFLLGIALSEECNIFKHFYISLSTDPRKPSFTSRMLSNSGLIVS